MRLFLLLVAVFPLIQALPPPPGVILKPAKQLDGEDEEVSSPPPNLSIRSRMMAALNSDPVKSDRMTLPAQPLILKRKKLKAAVVTQLPRYTTTSTSRPLPSSTFLLPPSADYGVTSMLKTNFVDRKGKVHQNLDVIPIRIGDGTAKKTVSASQLVEGEAAKGVQVRFGPAPLGKRI